MFKCKVCVEKDKRIADLHAQVAFLQKWVDTPQTTSLIQHEADAILSGVSHSIDVSDNFESPSNAPLSREEIAREAEALLTGAY